ncbi:hypothetical protein ACU686_10555 [Yinghuangia aomiensis]
MPRFAADNYAANLLLHARIADIARDAGCTPAQLALAWVLSAWPARRRYPGHAFDRPPAREHGRPGTRRARRGTGGRRAGPERGDRAGVPLQRRHAGGDRHGALRHRPGDPG